MILNIVLALTILTTYPIPESALVSKIHFQGNHSIKSKTLLKVLSVKTKEPFYEIELDKDVDNLKQLYEEQGFKKINIKSDVTSSIKGKVILFKIAEGARVKISSIKIDGNQSFSGSRVRSLFKLKTGDYLVLSKIAEAEKLISQFYKNSGFPYVTTKNKVSIDQNTASVSFIITEGPLAFIKELKVRGNQKVSNRIILRTCEIKVGARFSLSQLEKARQRLYATKLFERVSFYILDTPIKDSLVIRFDVLELPPRSIGFGFGFQTPPSGLLVSTEWEHLNFLSRGHDLFFSAGYAPTFTGDWLGELKSTYRVFYVLNTPINFTVQPSFKYEKTDSLKQDELNVEAGISRYVGPKFEIGTFLRYLRVWANFPLTFSSTYQSITNSQNFYARFDTRDNIFTPERGAFITTNLQYAGSVFDGDNDFYKSQTELIVFTKILPQFVVGFRTLIGFVIPYNRTIVVPYYETFSLGGNNGLRGYNDKSLGSTIIGDKYHYGEAVINTNIELRTHFEKLIDFVAFFDFGKITERKDLLNFDSEMLNYSTGIGIRINSPFGPIRFDYAKRLKNPSAGDWGKIHLAILNAF